MPVFLTFEHNGTFNDKCACKLVEKYPLHLWVHLRRESRRIKRLIVYIFTKLGNYRFTDSSYKGKDVKGMKFIQVVAAIIVCDNKVLCVQRGDAKYDYISQKWEFPGGKVEENESLKEALSREILEELDVELIDCKFFLTVDHHYPDFRIKMHSFICEMPSVSLKLREHLDSRWLNRNELSLLEWAAADLPIVAKLQT